MTKDDEAFNAAFADDVPDASDATPPQEEETTPPTDEGAAAGEETPEQPADGAGDQLTAPDTPEPAPQAPAPPTAEQFKGMLDEREKRQKFEAEAENLRREIEQLRQQTRKPETPPEFDWDNPESRIQYAEEQARAAMFEQTVKQSRFFASREFGEQAVQEAQAWAQGQPEHVQLHLSQQASPYHAAIEAMKKDRATQALAEHDYDIEKLIAARTQSQATPQPEAPAPQAAPPKPLPPSVRPSGAVTEAPKQTEDQVFRSVFS